MSAKQQNRRRFIAGAKCPLCNAQDRIVIYREGEKQYKHCVSCDFIEEMMFEPVFRELATRVNQNEEEKHQGESIVRLIDGGESSSRSD
jgi:uncharacterized metal-binding protein (TIGR02443 family)